MRIIYEVIGHFCAYNDLFAMFPKVGVVGSPDQVKLIIPVLQASQFRVTALWCKSRETQQVLGNKFGIAFLPAHFKDLLVHHEVDLVYVATEPSRQAEVAVKALTSGKHCICQKPPSLCRLEAEKMVSLSRYYNKLHSLLESHLRFLPAVHKLKSLLAEDYCGQLLVMEAHVAMGSLIHNEAYSWKCEPSMGGGVLNSVGAHIIDLISFVSRQHACRGHASLSTFRPTTNTIHGYRVISSDDFCCFQLQYAGGLAATVTLNSHATGQFQFQFSATGTQGRLVIRGLDLHGSREGEKEEILLKQSVSDLEQYGIKEGSVKEPQDLLSHILLGYREMFGALMRVFEGKEENLPSATFEDGVYIRTVLDTLHASNAEGRWLDIPKLDKGDSAGSNPFWTTTTQQGAASKRPQKAHSNKITQKQKT